MAVPASLVTRETVPRLLTALEDYPLARVFLWDAPGAQKIALPGKRRPKKFATAIPRARMVIKTPFGDFTL